VASNKNLAQEVKAGRFRADLFYRIMGLPIELPPLRTRGNDILLLARYFADEFCLKNKMPQKRFSSSAQEKLMNYSYPGNVRELKAIIELACVMSTTNTITAEDINIQLTTITLEQINFEDKTLEEYIEEIVTAYIKKYNGNIKEVASKLGVGKTTLYRMIKKNPHIAKI